MDKNISENLSDKYGQRLLDHAKQSAADAIKTSLKRAIQRTEEQLVILSVIKFLIELQKFQKIHSKII